MKKVDAEKLKGAANEAAEKGKGFINEFKAFVLRGNVMDMAIGVIIGSAFANIVTALTNDFINPLINSVGGAEVAGHFELPWAQGQFIEYGHFITSVINFVIMAFILFLLLKSFNKLMTIGKKKEEEAKEEIKKSNEELLLEEIRDLLKEGR